LYVAEWTLTIPSTTIQDLVETASHERIGVNFKNIKQFVKRFHMSKRFSQSRERPFNVVLENIVHDVSLIRTTMPSTNLLWKCNKLFPSKRRPLFPDIEDLKEGLVGKLRTNQKGHLLISVVGANNVQKREDQFDSKHTPFLMSTSYIKGPSSELPFLSSPNPDSLYRGNTTSAFIRIRFQGKTYHTRIDSGHCPLWEQVIKVPLCFGDDNILTPLKLKRLEEEIEITLFDRVEFDYGKGGGYYSDEETLTGENRFLGFKKVPLEALYQEGKIQGNCILNTPPLILGYEQMSVANTSQISQQELVSRQVLDEIKNDPESQRDEKQMTNCSQPFTSLNLSISVGPSLGCISESRHYYDLPSNECLSTIQYAKDWIDAYINTHCFCAKRYHDILVPAMNGRTWLVNRFLHSQVPPTSCKSSMQRCAHFVSLIPFLNNWISFKTLKQTCNVWSPTQKFLDIMAGNWSEHAVLLANYFMFLSDTGLETPTFDVYLAFGSSITEQRVVSFFSLLFP
jgi:coiled-coil and C2 domain-containing protein 2A